MKFSAEDVMYAPCQDINDCSGWFVMYFSKQESAAKFRQYFDKANTVIRLGPQTYEFRPIVRFFNPAMDRQEVVGVYEINQED